MTEYHIRFDRG